MRYILVFILSMLWYQGIAQLHYTENLYDYRIETNIEYGQAIDYAGNNDTLLLDIYKPIGDENCLRPCLVLIHGGSWIGGSKNDVNIERIAGSFAEKGWVVATINYRLGTHKSPSYVMYAFCNDDISAPCAYICDSAEVFRANYRGQQDAKGAIRFMKNRGILDSIDVKNVFVAGESAGAFIAYAAAFMNNETDKPEFCNSIADAPTPDSDLIHCLPDEFSLSRPDLGGVNGSLNLGEHNASVEGVGSIYGGMMDFDMLADEADWPVIYGYHQGNDVVVHYNYYRLLGRIDWECYSPTNLCQNYARYPKAYGTKGIKSYLDGLVDGPISVFDIIENYEYTGDCFDNGHSIDNWVLRSNNMANLFAGRIAENGNEPNDGPCALSINEEHVILTVYPNPSTGIVHFNTVDLNPKLVQIFNTKGQLILEKTMSNQLQVTLPTGLYFIHLVDERSMKIATQKLIIN